MAYESCGAWRSSSVAFAGSVVTRDFICESTSRSCAGGSVLRVREIASGQERPAGRSTPCGSGGRELEVPLCGATIGGGIGRPLGGGYVINEAPCEEERQRLFVCIRSRKHTASSSAPSLEKSTRNLRFIISKSFRFRTADAAESRYHAS